MPIPEDLPKAYRQYFTHQAPRSFSHRIVQYIKQGYLAHSHNRNAPSVSSVQKFFGLLAYAAPFRRAGLDKLGEYLTSAPRGQLLDVGCGDGAILEYMQQQGWQAEGLDFDPVAVERARAKGLKAQAGDLESQHYPDASFAAIVMSHLIEHIHNPAGLLRESYRILGTGGRLIVLTPNIQSWGHRRFGSAWYHLDPPRHLHLFTVPSLCVLLERAGYTKITAATTLRNIRKIVSASRCIRRHGRYIPPGWRWPFSSLSVASMEFAEWIAWKRDTMLGEEIGLIAEKQPKP